MENSASIEYWKISILFHLCTNNYRETTSDICVESWYMENSVTFDRKLQDIDSFIYVRIIIV